MMLKGDLKMPAATVALYCMGSITTAETYLQISEIFIYGLVFTDSKMFGLLLPS